MHSYSAHPQLYGVDMLYGIYMVTWNVLAIGGVQVAIDVSLVKAARARWVTCSRVHQHVQRLHVQHQHVC
jgi:hypothetical protein